jgi:glycine hydroxymethyltransferase
MNSTAVEPFWQRSIAETDPWLAAILEREEERQFSQICLGAASSLCPRAVKEAQASVFSNIDAEGYPPRRMHSVSWEHLLDVDEQVAHYGRFGDSRYNKGTELANVVEVVAQRRAAAVFSTRWANNSNLSVDVADIHVNLQCPTGSLANTAVFEALLKPGDVVLSMNLVDGGHLTHGSPLHRSGKTYRIVHYGVDPVTQQLDYDSIRDLALCYHPKLIVGGASSYPWAIDWQRLREIAEGIEPKPFILADISHPAGLVSAGLIPNPIGYADVVTFTTYKTLCGPRGAAILSTDSAIAEAIDRAVFPGLQSAPVFQQIVALAVAFKIVGTQEFRQLQRNIVENARLLHYYLTEMEIPVAFGGTDTHIVVADVGKVSTATGQRLTGDVVTRILERAGISCNSNMIPGDTHAALASGVRLGTTWISQLGYGETEVREIASIIASICKGITSYRFYGARRETPGGKIDAELLRSARLRVKEILKHRNAHFDAFPRRKYLEIRAATNWLEALLVTGERAASFLQSIVTRDVYSLKVGELVPALILHAHGGKRLNVYICDLEGEAHARYLLVYARDTEPDLYDWLRMLSDGHIQVEGNDPFITLDGPVIIQRAASRFLDEVKSGMDHIACSLDGNKPEEECLIDHGKPYFIGQMGLPAAAKLNKQGCAFEEMRTSTFVSRPSPLYDCHKASGASFTDFAGQPVPLYFASSSSEHQSVRRHAGLFDLSYKVLLGFEGQGAERFLDLVLTEHIPSLNSGASCRACILSPDGMILSACILYRLAPDYFVMELEPLHAEVVENWLRAVAAREVLIDLERPAIEVDRTCSITNLTASSDSLTLMALQGPASIGILQFLLGDNKHMLHHLKKGHIAEFAFAGRTVWMARRGYTGEPVGYEIFVPRSQAAFLWKILMEAGFAHRLNPVGLLATESLRIEAGLPLYGKELAGPYSVNPVEAGFGSAIKLHKPFFVGRQQVLSCKPTRRLVRLRAEIDAASLEHLEPTIYDDEGKVIGIMTSSASAARQFYGIGLLDKFEPAKGYLSFNGLSLGVEILPVPYGTVVGA